MFILTQRSIHLYFKQETYTSKTRKQLIDTVRQTLTKAGLEYSNLAAKGFDETSTYLSSYIKVIVKDVDPFEDNLNKWNEQNLAVIRKTCDELIKIEGLFFIDNIRGQRMPDNAPNPSDELY